MPAVRDSYPTALNAKLKYHAQMRKIRQEEDGVHGARRVKADDEMHSEVSNQSSMFRYFRGLKFGRVAAHWVLDNVLRAFFPVLFCVADQNSGSPHRARRLSRGWRSTRECRKSPESRRLATCQGSKRSSRMGSWMSVQSRSTSRTAKKKTLRSMRPSGSLPTLRQLEVTRLQDNIDKLIMTDGVQEACNSTRKFRFPANFPKLLLSRVKVLRR